SRYLSCAALISILLHSLLATVLHTLSLHDALPILAALYPGMLAATQQYPALKMEIGTPNPGVLAATHHNPVPNMAAPDPGMLARSEEHTSELQSRFDLVCRLLLEKKNNHKSAAITH